MNAGPYLKLAIAQAQANANLDGKPAFYLLTYGGNGLD